MGAIIELFYEIDNVCLSFWQIKPDSHSFLIFQYMNQLQVMAMLLIKVADKADFHPPSLNDFIILKIITQCKYCKITLLVIIAVITAKDIFT